MSTPAGASTSSHPSSSTSAPVATSASNATEGGLAASAPPSSPELARLKVKLLKTFRTFPDFPIPGINFLDILPLFAEPNVHEDLIQALELFVRERYPNQRIDHLVGLDARGFLFGPSLALRLKCGFVPVRKPGKLPGPVVTASYVKEYGKDEFGMQEDAVPKGSNCLIVDDIIATGGSASAAGELVKKAGANVIGYLFLHEIPGLNGSSKIEGPVHTLLEGAKFD